MAKTEWAYTDLVREHFTNPRNILDDEEAFNPDGRGMVGNPQCGDEMLMVIKVDKVKNIISECRWKTYGCASAIASTSMLSEVVTGMKLEEAFKITPKDIVKKLGGLPDRKIHCSVLGDKALRAAINDYYKKNGMLDKIREENRTLICQCMTIYDSEIEDAVLEGARTFIELQEKTKISTVCGQCRDRADELMLKYIEKHFAR
ncbi:MAG: iron-sulfur cluster assembly scaffold protein [Candidatus Wallbacteria bacterium]|nr:iron-sulfur cluster assembly scaffold protein [Candidatus Wallbacteria bacterium]